MSRPLVSSIVVAAIAGASVGSALAQGQSAKPDPRLQEITYDPNAVITLHVQRGVVTHVMLDEAEAITDVGSGLGAECNKPESTWCIAAQSGGRHLFIKPKSGATVPNNLAVVTNWRTHAFRLVVLPPGDSRPPVYRLAIKAPAPRAQIVSAAATTLPGPASDVAIAIPLAAALPTADELVAERLTAAPMPVNWHYTLAEGAQSQDIVPTLIFDDGRFTYLKFPNNREVPAVFHVLGDGSETLVNARMEGDLLVVDRVSRRLMLRAGQAVVGVWNEAFDLDGLPPKAGTTVEGVRRVLRAGQVTADGSAR